MYLYRGARVFVLRVMFRQVAALLVGTLLIAPPTLANDILIANNVYLDMDIEELFTVEVTSVSKKAEKMSETPNAVYVITADEIRRAGVTSIPDALRLAPGMNVGRLDNNRWAISARGLNGLLAPNLLVMIDGRSVYTPLWNGVEWTRQDLLIEDVDRIEVMRGPGGTIWGSHAVNGVINIITKNAPDTQGALATVTAGNEERTTGALRYGAPLGETGHIRAFVKYVDRDGVVTVDNKEELNDDLKSYRGGFRYDGALTDSGALTVSGEYYENRSPELGTSRIGGEDVPTVLMAGYHVIADYRHTLSEGNVIHLKTFYDATEEGVDGFDPVDTIKTFEIDFHHLYRLSDANEFSWGATLRQYDYTQQKTESIVVFDPASAVEYRYSAFAQDTITLIPDALSLILGIKAEHNEYSGLEYQPTARLLYQASELTSYWLAVSRSLSTPSRATAQMSIYSPHFTLLASPDFQPEELIAFEGGVKTAPAKNLTIDLALFYNLFDNVATNEYRVTDSGAYELWTGNKGSMTAYGAELAATWAPVEFWRLTLTLSTYSATGEVDADSVEEELDLYAAGSAPKYQVGLRSWIDLPFGFSFDAAAYYVDKQTYRELPSYTKVDARLGWRNNAWDVAVVGQNLLNGGQQEESPGRYGSNALIEQSLFFKVVYHQ